MKNSILIWLILLFFNHLSFAQYSNLKFENFDTNNGLSSSTSVEIFQDSEGFLWFGTIDGLDMYNAMNLKFTGQLLMTPIPLVIIGSIP